MSYTVKSSEKTRKTGADCETKALLYLMNFRNDSDEIHYFVVDFFNDLTGMDRYSTKLWDVQSKGASNNSPAAIGRELVTLFKNFISDFGFQFYILFLGGVSPTVRVDNKLSSFKISNITPTSVRKLKLGLLSEAQKKKYIPIEKITDPNMENFLSRVLFVIDDKQPEEYVKGIIKNHPCIIPEKPILNAIFNEIRETQSGKKNTNVEGVVIQTTEQALDYCRHLTNNEIRLMALSRIINKNPVEKNSIPPSFVSTYNRWPPEQQKDMLDACIQSLCRALFNKNVADAFWTLFETIYNLTISNPTYTVEEIYQNIDISIKKASPDFDVISLKYFISVIKDGVQQ